MDLKKIEETVRDYKKAFARAQSLRGAVAGISAQNEYLEHYHTRINCQQGTSMDHYIEIEIPHAAARPFILAELHEAEGREAELRIKLHAMTQILEA